MSAARKPRVVSADAKVILIEATISLLREIPVIELSTRKIEARSGLDRRAITRQFGGEVELFVATLAELSDRAFKRVSEQQVGTSNFVDEDLKTRTDLLAFLILSGVDPERLKSIQPPTEGTRVVLERIGMHPKTPERVQEAFFTLLQGLALSRTFFGPTSALNTLENEIVVFKMLHHLASMGPELPALLGIEIPES